MKNLSRKLIALLLAVCLFASVLPMVSAYDLKVAPINLQTRGLVDTNVKVYKLFYQAETTMIDDLATIVSIHKNRWDILDKLVWTCTLTDVLTAKLTTATLPEFYFISCKMKGEDVFVSLKEPYVEGGSIKLEYRLNPKLDAMFKNSTAEEVRTSLVQPMEMALYAEKEATPAELEGITKVHTTATIDMTTNDGSNIYYYNAPSALLAKGEADMEIKPIDQPPIDLEKNHDPFMRGYPDLTFKPEGSITRAEVAMMLYRRLLDGDDHGMIIPDMDKPDPNAKKVFADVEPDAWYGTAVYHLAEKGYINGTNMGNYRPDDPITRAELCVLLVRFSHPDHEYTYNPDFEDVPKTHWAYDSIMKANAYGWVEGVGGNRFSPDRYITRTEAAKMFCVMLERYGDKLAASDEKGRFFPDVSTSHWGYMWIAEVTTRHEYKPMGEFEVWTKIYDFEGNLITTR